uniref:SNKR2GH5 protein n=1 Tax=Solanum tuberosum TaxID=4113 RepID=M1C8U0_SOLTU
MADAFLSFALRKLGDFLSQQVSLLTSLRDEIKWLRNELLFIQPFLKDAELKQCGDQRVVQWVFEINSIANDVVAILETYTFEADKRASCLKACACICRKEKKLYNVAKDIKSLKKRIMDISRKRETYGITTTSHKKGLNEWQKVKDHLWKNIKEDKSIEISNILSLSYNDLPAALKQCFLYFGIFPEDQVFEADNIIRLWMAEGFIPRGEERMEDTAEGFLNELIRRSLVQVAKTFWERVTECKVHDLLHDLVIQKALEVNFFDIYDPKSHSISSLCIKHVIHSQGERYPSLDLSNLKLRSLMSFDPDFRKMSLINFRSVFQHLYVLYLEMRVDNMSIVLVPDAIGSLYHLKFLSLRGIDDLPSSIGNLKNLQTLVVNEGKYTCQLPRETADLINLRHLVARYSKPLVHISKLTSLQVVDGIHCDQWKDVDPVDLVNLGELSMHHIKKSYSLNNISSLKNLSILTLFCECYKTFPSLEFVNCCEKLQKLRLKGVIEKLPDLFPNSITMMVLRDSRLTEDPMPILGTLPNLRNLELIIAYEGKEMMCRDNSFSQLDFLILNDLYYLERWHLATNSMPLIKGFAIYDCPNLKKIPERLKDVKQR